MHIERALVCVTALGNLVLFGSQRKHMKKNWSPAKGAREQQGWEVSTQRMLREAKNYNQSVTITLVNEGILLWLRNRYLLPCRY